MSLRSSIRLPVVLGVFMLILLVALTVGWVFFGVSGILEDAKRSALYITLLTLGTTFLVLVIVGTILYLALSVKAINLTRRQSNFIDSVTHELKSPISSLKLYLQTLSRRSVDDSQREDFYRSMLDDVERLDHLINDLLDAASLDKEPDQVEQSIQLHELLQDCAQSICQRHRLPEDTIRVETDPCSVKRHRVHLDMVFRNLMENAVKYGGDPPQVLVQAHPAGLEAVVVSIQDNGRGVPRSQRKNIFRRFVRLGSELERTRPGTGLGLYIVKTLVRSFGGRIRVYDAEKQMGTVFEVVVPGRLAGSHTGIDSPMRNANVTTSQADPKAAQASTD